MNPKDWYKILNTLCVKLGRKYNVSPEVVAGIITELSAQKQFKENIRQTVQFLKSKPLTGMFTKKQVINCQKIRDGENPLNIWSDKSLKYRNFYGSILLNPESCCIDSHMIHIYLQKKPKSKLHKSKKEYIFSSKVKYAIIQNWVKQVAKQRGILPYECQAILWCEIRGRNF